MTLASPSGISGSSVDTKESDIFELNLGFHVHCTTSTNTQFKHANLSRNIRTAHSGPKSD